MSIRYTRPALADLEEILAYVEARSPQGARRVLQRIESLVQLLPERPWLGRSTDDPTIRRLAVPPFPYLVFYETVGGEIMIHAIRHGARDPASMPGR